MRIIVGLVVAIALAVAGYSWLVLHWSYSTGERAGWLRRCRTRAGSARHGKASWRWFSMPGAIPEKFYFTVRDDAVASQINAAMGKRVTLHYRGEGRAAADLLLRRHAVLRHPRDRGQDVPLGPRGKASSMISMPGAVPKFQFTVRDDAVAEQINRQMGKRVALHYEESGAANLLLRRHAVLRHPRDRGQDVPLGPKGACRARHRSTLAPVGPAEELRRRRDEPWRDPRVPASEECVLRPLLSGDGRHAGQGVRALRRWEHLDLWPGERAAAGWRWDSAAWASAGVPRSRPGCPMARMPSASGSGSTISARSTCRSTSRTAGGTLEHVVDNADARLIVAHAQLLPRLRARSGARVSTPRWSSAAARSARRRAHAP